MIWRGWADRNVPLKPTSVLASRVLGRLGACLLIVDDSDASQTRAHFSGFIETGERIGSENEEAYERYRHQLDNYALVTRGEA